MIVNPIDELWNTYQIFVGKQNRYDHFLAESLVQSNVDQIHRIVEFHELGFAVDFVKEGLTKMDVQKIKNKIVEKTPIVALYDMCRRDGAVEVDDYKIKDNVYRKKVSLMSTDKLIYAAKTADIDIETQVDELWRKFLLERVYPSGIILPKSIKPEIFDQVVNNRCSKEAKNFKGNSPEILKSILDTLLTKSSI